MAGKTFTFKPKRTDPPEIQEFFENQINKADAIRILIVRHIAKYGTADITCQNILTENVPEVTSCVATTEEPKDQYIPSCFDDD